MIFPPHLPVALLLQAALCLASAATNYSVDDQDPLFQYSGTWERNLLNINSIGGNLDMDGGHMLTTTLGSSATITYTFASVYFLSTLWPYPVSTDYAIDGNAPVTIDMQDHSVPATTPDKNATVASGVVGHWTSSANQEHTIHVTIPPGGEFAVVDMFIFEVLDPSNTSSTTVSSTSLTSSSTGTTSGTASSFSSSSSSSSSSSGSQGSSLTIERNLAISMGVVGTLLAILIVFLLWRFCIRRKGKNGENIMMNPITPQYHAVPTIPENDTHVPLDDNSVSTRMRSDGATSHYGLGIQNNNIQRPPIILSYDRGTSSHSGLPPTLHTDQSTSSLPRTQRIHHNPQERISTPSMMTDMPPMYCRNPILDESSAVSSSSSSNGITNEKRTAITLSYTAVAEPEDELTSTTIPGRHEENVSVWDSGYSQPLRFVPIA